MIKKLKRKTESEELLDFARLSQQEENMRKFFISFIFVGIAIGKTFLCFDSSIGLDYSFGIHQNCTTLMLSSRAAISKT